MMLNLNLASLRRLTVIGAHPDDIEIAAGGTLLTVAAAVPGLRVHYVLLTGEPARQLEARDAARAFLPGADLTFATGDLPDGRLPAYWGQAKEMVEAAAAELAADLVLAPSQEDAHQDHRALAKLVPTAFRDSLILHYEIPKWDGDLSRPTMYVPLTDDTARRKIELLHTHFPSQKHRDWWDDEVFLGLARLRGMEIRTRYAEAFHCHKAALGLGITPS